MARKRTSGSQSKHDQAVRERAQQLQRQGYKVKADLPGWERPGTIRGVRPDVDARKTGQRMIVEVETPESVGDQRAERQEAAFRGAAARSKGGRFEKIVTR